jgi:hypothetical protein
LPPPDEGELLPPDVGGELLPDFDELLQAAATINTTAAITTSLAFLRTICASPLSMGIPTLGEPR